MDELSRNSFQELPSQPIAENAGQAIEFSSARFASLPPHLKRRLFAFDAGGVYARGIFLNIPSPKDADFEILDEGRKLRVYPRRKLSQGDLNFIAVTVMRAGVIRVHFITAQGELIQGE